MHKSRINGKPNRFTIDVVIGCAEFLAAIEIVSGLFFREINNYFFLNIPAASPVNNNTTMAPETMASPLLIFFDSMSRV